MPAATGLPWSPWAFKTERHASTGRDVIQLINTLCAADADWLELRTALWPHRAQDAHLAQMLRLVADPNRFLQLIAYEAPGRPVGLAEASVRTDHVNGTTSQPVAFLEGLYVNPRLRRQGVARAMVIAVERWAIDQGCTEFASDALADHRSAHRLHRALGFEESQRVVFFRKKLTQDLGRANDANIP